MLLDLAVEQDGHLVIPEKLTQKEMANRVGASREMINRILRDLTTGGYIKVEAGRIADPQDAAGQVVAPGRASLSDGLPAEETPEIRGNTRASDPG